MAENNVIHTVNTASQLVTNRVGRGSCLFACNRGVGSVTQNSTNAIFGTYFGSAGPTFTYPSTSKSIVFGDLNSNAHLVNPQFHQGRPNLFPWISPNPVQTALPVGSQTGLVVADARPKESVSMHRETVSNTLHSKRLAKYEARLD